MTIITELEQQIRRFINAPRKHLAIFKDSTNYHKMCSCLDVIGDTELAFQAYKEMPDDLPTGSSYVLAYGFLQALVLQQDAMRNLYEALQIPSESDCLLQEIRELRNDAIGHPTKRGRGKGKSFSRISRPSISKSGFELMTVEPNKGPPTVRFVSFKSLLDVQHMQLEKALGALLEALRREEMEHQNQFRDEKLAALFPPQLSYHFEKVYEAVRGGDGWEYEARNLPLIREVFENFKAALEMREIIGSDTYMEYRIKRLQYPLAQLAEYFSERGEGRLNTNDVEIFTSFVQDEMSNLQEMACEIDTEYAAEQR